jgi:hypothetical protein
MMEFSLLFISACCLAAAGIEGDQIGPTPSRATASRLAGVPGGSASEAAGESDEKSNSGEPEPYVTESIRGQVVWMADALEQRFGIGLVREAREHLLALQTTDGRLLPIMEDVRGRSFRMDDRLREMDLELLVRHYEQPPMIQVIRVYEIQDGEKYILDYWCDVCAIVMFQLGPCDCCQATNHLRKRPADDSVAP